MGFEPTTSTVTGWRALRAAPRGQVPGAGVEPTSAGSGPDVLPVRRPRNLTFPTPPVRQGSGRRVRTFIAWFKARQPTVSRPPSKSTKQRKERESNPQGSALGRFRDGCHRPLACPSVRTAAAGIEPAIVSLTGSRLTLGPRRKSQDGGIRTHAFRFPKPADCRAFLRPERRTKHPAGIEPARPAWRAGRLPLHHGCKWDPRDSNPHHAG